MKTPFRYGNRLFSLAGQLLIFPALKYFIAGIFGYGWDRNRAIDSKGTHNNALMGGYLLAASNTVINITGILTTDTIIPLTSGGNVGTVTVNGTMSFTTGNNYGAFEVYRGTTRIGRYCLTERQGLQIINQVTGGLQNGLLGGTTTTVWQRSNAFYCETNHSGYSISGTGWVTSAGSALTVGTIIPADLVNPTKCLAWVGGVQQGLQYVGKARNNVSFIPISFNCNADRYWLNPVTAVSSMTSHRIEMCCIIAASVTQTKYLCGESMRFASMLLLNSTIVAKYNNTYQTATTGNDMPLNTPIIAYSEYDGALGYIKAGWTNLFTGASASNTADAPSSLNMAAHTNQVFNGITGNFAYISESVNGVIVSKLINSQHDTYIIDVTRKATRTINGVSTALLQNVNCGVFPLIAQGYELWTNGTDYRIYPIADDGTRFITPAGYTLVETVAPNTMPSVADSRLTTVKYSLANSNDLYKAVPEAFDATDPCAPKLLTYSELSALSANPKVIKTEVNGKITNLKIIQ